jgi:hypothetical protein
MKRILELLAYEVFKPNYKAYIPLINGLLDKNQSFTSRTHQTPLAFTYNATDYYHNLFNLHPDFKPSNHRIPRLNYSLQLNDIKEAHAALTQIKRDKTFIVQSWLSLDKHQDDYLESFNAVLSTIPPLIATTVSQNFNCNYSPEQFNEDLLPKVTELLHLYAAMHILKS